MFRGLFSCNDVKRLKVKSRAADSLLKNQKMRESYQDEWIVKAASEEL